MASFMALYSKSSRVQIQVGAPSFRTTFPLIMVSIVTQDVSYLFKSAPGADSKKQEEAEIETVIQIESERIKENINVVFYSNNILWKNKNNKFCCFKIIASNGSNLQQVVAMWVKWKTLDSRQLWAWVKNYKPLIDPFFVVKVKGASWQISCLVKIIKSWTLVIAAQDPKSVTLST